MFQHILVPLDGSARAEQAIPVAARLAAANAGELLALYVVNPPAGYDEHTETQTVEVQQALQGLQEGALKYLDLLAAQPYLAGIQVQRAMVVGEPVAVIVTAVDSYHADFIVMGSHGYTGRKRYMVGSAAEEVAQSVTVPVLVLREGKPLSSSLHLDDMSLVRVLVPLDGSTEAQDAIGTAAQTALSLSTPARGALHLVRVVILPDNVPASYGDREDIMHEAQRYLSSAVEETRRKLQIVPQRLRLTGSVTVDDDVAAGIARIAESGEDTEGASLQGGCDIIAMATHGYGGVKRGVTGGIAERVLQATRLPLLFVHVPNAAQRARATHT